MSTKVEKAKYWAMIAYPDSLPDDWRDILAQSGIQCAISPLHDQDCNSDGEVKKAHYHIILCYPNPTTKSNVLKLSEALWQPQVQALASVRGYYRYLTHKDNPEKYQYDDKDITTINGFSISDHVDFTRAEVFHLKKQVIAYIRERGIIEYAQLIMDLTDDDLGDMLDIASTNTIYFNNFITSYRHMHMDD